MIEIVYYLIIGSRYDYEKYLFNSYSEFLNHLNNYEALKNLYKIEINLKSEPYYHSFENYEN